MKKINYLLIALVIGFSLTSCYDDDPINKFPTQGLANIDLSVAAPNTATAEGFVVPFTATIPQTFSSDVSVEARLTFEGGIVNNSVTIPAGQTSASGTVSMQGDDGLEKFDGRSVDLSLTGLSVSDPAVGEPSAFNIASNNVTLTSYDRVQWPYGAATIAGRMTALFDWGNPGGNDLDMLMFNADTFDNVESAASGDRWETDIFNDTHPDGNYFIAIDFWIATGDDIPWKLFFVHPDQKTISSFSGTFTNVTATGGGGGDFIFPLINFTKSTDADDNVTYTFSQP